MAFSNLGVIDGFFGRAWSWNIRYDYAQFLQQHGYDFYIYAPKSDTHLRKHWQTNWPPEEKEFLIRLGEIYKQAGLMWGIGLSPFEIYLNYDGDAIAAIERKIQDLNPLDLDIIAVLFDDMRRDVAQISQIQVDVVHRIADLSNAKAFRIAIDEVALVEPNET